MTDVAIIILAGGSGSRLGAGTNKVLLHVGGEPVLTHSVRAALSARSVSHLVLVARAGEEDAVATAITPALGDTEVRLVTGGVQRHESEWKGLQAIRSEIVRGDIGVVAIHDAARPMARPALFDAVVEAARLHGAALPVRPQSHLIARDGHVPTTAVGGVQTPQAFGARTLWEAHTAAAAHGFVGTDTASVLEWHRPGTPVVAVRGPASNIKVTFADDLAIAEALIRA